MESSIGVFDSGLGGVSVLREAIRVLPHERFIYYGDNRNAPYGDRTEAEITKLTLRCAHTLANQGVKAILIACNTATATCIERIRNELDVPVVSVEPAIKPACMQPGYRCNWQEAHIEPCGFHRRFEEIQERMDALLRSYSIDWLLYGRCL